MLYVHNCTHNKSTGWMQVPTPFYRKGNRLVRLISLRFSKKAAEWGWDPGRLAPQPGPLMVILYFSIY